MRSADLLVIWKDGAVTAVSAGQAAGQRPELRGVAAPLAAAGEEPVSGEEGLSLPLALRTRQDLCQAGFRPGTLLVVFIMKLLRSTGRLGEWNLIFKV